MFVYLFHLIFLFLTSFSHAKAVQPLNKEEDSRMANHFFIITGGPGSGKTTLIEELKRRGLCCIEEVGRRVIQDESTVGGEALPWKDLKKCIEKMVICSIESYKEALNSGQEPLIFDRGVLDYISYARRTQTAVSYGLIQAAHLLVYNRKVFLAPPWEEIYCTDNERKQTFEESLEVYQDLIRIYTEQGYKLVELPKVSVERRADFLINQIKH